LAIFKSISAWHGLVFKAARFKIFLKIGEQSIIVFDSAKKCIATGTEYSPDSPGRVAVVNTKTGLFDSVGIGRRSLSFFRCAALRGY
jgi:hypothetical protein